MARISIAWHDVTWRCMVWYCISNEWRCMAWGGIALHGMARYGVAWNGTGLHCTGCMVLHFMSWCDIAWHGLAVLIVHTHCCWDSCFGVLPQRAITLFQRFLQWMTKASALTLTCLLGMDGHDYFDMRRCPWTLDGDDNVGDRDPDSLSWSDDENEHRLAWHDNRVKDHREMDRMAPLHRWSWCWT